MGTCLNRRRPFNQGFFMHHKVLEKTKWSEPYTPNIAEDSTKSL